MSQRIAIIGGGISGLTAAYTLEKARRAGVAIEYRLFEAGQRLGGVIRSERIVSPQGEFLVECGPDSFLSAKPEAIELCRELGLADDLIGSNDVERKTYIYAGGRLVAMPDGLQFMVPTRPMATAFSPLVSLRTKLRFAREYVSPPPSASGEESVAGFIERHFGREVVERLADPLLSGVYGGTADALSVDAVLPQFVAMEKQHGSLIRAALANRKVSATRGPLFTTLAHGLEQMTMRLVAELDPKKIAVQVPVQTLQRITTGWLVRTSQALEPFDAVILAVPANTAGGLLRNVAPELAESLNGIQYGSSAIVVFAYGAESGVAKRLPAGFGFLAPRSEGTRMRAMTFVHKKFSGRAPVGAALLRMFYGGTADEAATMMGDDALLALARKELLTTLGVPEEPAVVRIYRWPNAMAQYNLGHKQRVDRITRQVQAVGQLQLCGNALHGIGIPDCIRSGREAAEAAHKTKPAA